MQKKRNFTKILTLFVIFDFLLFTGLDFFTQQSSMISYLRFLAVAACFLIGVSRRRGAFLALGLAFTVVADFCLLIADIRLAGVAIFCAVHVLYIFRSARPPVLAIALILTSAALAFGISKTGIDDVLSQVSLFYAVLFVFDIACAVLVPRGDSRINKAFLVSGLILFALCDVNVLLYYLRLEGFYETAIKLVWIFYLPSQLFIAYS